MAALRSFSPVLLLSRYVLIVGVSGALICFLAGQLKAYITVMGVLRIVTLVLVGWAAFQGRRNARPAFRLLTPAILMYIVGDICALTVGPGPLTVIAYAAFYLLATGSVFRLRRTMTVTPGLALDLLTVLLIPGIPIFALLLQAAPQAAHWQRDVVYSSLDLLLFSGLAGVLMARRDAPRVFEFLLVLATALIVVGDLWYIRQQLFERVPSAGLPAWLWALGMSCYGWAATVVIQEAQRPSARRLRWNVAAGLRNALPYLSGASVAAAWWSVKARTPVMDTVVVGMLALTGSLILRQGLSVGEQRRLVRRTLRATQELRLAHQRLRQQVYVDTLTGIANRPALMDYLQGAVTRTAPLTILMLDLNWFKTVNDTHGHQAGDRVLQVTAQRLTDLCARRLRTPHLVARLGGDEFVVVVAGNVDTEHLAHDIHTDLTASIPLTSEQTVRIGTAVGWTASTAPHPSIDTLLSRADQAMYRDKESERAR